MSALPSQVRGHVARWFDDAATAAVELTGAEDGSHDRLRAALQGLALVDGIPGELARDVMRVARSISAFDWDDEEAPPEFVRELCEAFDGVRVAVEDLLAAEDGADAAKLASGPRFMEVPDDPLVLDFVSECEEHLESAEESLLALEHDPRSSEELGSIFRCFHTIKGGAGLLGLEPVAGLAHAAEFLLDKARNGDALIQGDAAELCYGVLDTFREILTAVGGGDDVIELPEVYDAQMDALARLVAGESDLDDDDGSAGPTAQRPQIDLDASNAESPAADDADTSAALPTLAPFTEGEDDAAPAPISDLANDATSTTDPDAALAAAFEDLEQDDDEMESRGSERGPTTETAQSSKARRTTQSAVKVDTDRLDKLIDLVGELVITNAIVGQEITSEIPTHDPRQRTIAQLSKVTNELQSITMSMRMVPLKGTFQKATRIVRDVARKCGKNVRLVTVGEDTELDRSVVERLSDPLIHMLRNAVDHGVEKPAARAEAGKPATGTIRLFAEHRAGSVVIELSDDGAGFSRERLLAKAIERGIHTQEEAESMPDSQVWNLIFHPGLSTAAELSDVSGRGVGMDVVRKNIEALRGSVAIESTPGKGSRFIIRLPLTLAIIDGMVIESGDRSLIFPMQSIDGFVSPTADSIRTVKGQGEVVVLRGTPVPVHRISSLLSSNVSHASDSEPLLALVWADGSKVALRIDGIGGQQQVVIKSLASGLSRAPFISGAAILGNGSVGLVVDVESLVRSCTGSSQPTVGVS